MVKLILPRLCMSAKNNSTKNSKENFLVRIDPDTALKLTRLGHMGEIPSDVIKKLVKHANICDFWQLKRDEEDEL